MCCRVPRGREVKIQSSRPRSHGPGKNSCRRAWGAASYSAELNSYAPLAEDGKGRPVRKTRTAISTSARPVSAHEALVTIHLIYRRGQASTLRIAVKNDLLDSQTV